MKKILIALCSLVLAFASAHLNAAPLGTAFTYQGRLTDGANSANGTIPMVFGLWDADMFGNNVGSPSSFPSNVLVANGLFSIDLDFGATAFRGDARWLEIRVNGTLMTTRQRVAPTPNALYASIAGTANGVAANGVSGISLQAGSLQFNGPTYLHENTLYFGSDASHGVGYRSTYAGMAAIDGPVLFGYGGGGLGSTVPDVLALSWNRQGDVGIGGDLAYAGRLSKLDVANNFTASIGCGDFRIGYSTRRGSPGLALVDTTDTLNLNFPSDGWPNTAIWGNTISAHGNLSLEANRTYVRGFDAGGFHWFGYGTDSDLMMGLHRNGPNNYDFIANGNFIYSGQQNKLDVSDNFEASVRAADFKLGHSSRRGTPGRALVDLGTELHVNFGNDWGRTVIGGSSTSVKVLQITGGADLAEPFPMKEEKIEKGSVVVIDEEHSGRLKLSTRAYDTQVAGIVSGANGVNPGIALHQAGVIEGGQNVSLTGRVYVQADASTSPIKPGDLLTTSNTPGHAMKVTDHAQAQGAIIGKAMSALKEGKGMVLVLVSLQ